MGCLGRGQIVSYNHNVGSKVADVLTLFANKVVQNSTLNVVNIGDTLGHVLVGRLQQHQGLLTQNNTGGILGGNQLVADGLGDFAVKFAVTQIEPMHVENSGGLAAELFGDRLAEAGYLSGGVSQGLTQTAHLGPNVRTGQVPSRNAVVLGIDDHSRRKSYAARYGDTLLSQAGCLFLGVSHSSPNPYSIRPARAATA